VKKKKKRNEQVHPIFRDILNAAFPKRIGLEICEHNYLKHECEACHMAKFGGEL